MTNDWAALLSDPRQDDRMLHHSLAVLRQRIYQIVAGYEDANDADRLRRDPALQMVADQELGPRSSPSRWENAPSARDLVQLNDALLDQFIRLCGQQVRQRGEILLHIDSTDVFNGAYGQHTMYHPMLVVERHTGCLLAARWRPGNASSHARIVPMLLRLVPRLEAAFPGVPPPRCRHRSKPKENSCESHKRLARGSNVQSHGLQLRYLRLHFDRRTPTYEPRVHAVPRSRMSVQAS